MLNRKNFHRLGTLGYGSLLPALFSDIHDTKWVPFPLSPVGRSYSKMFRSKHIDIPSFLL